MNKIINVLIPNIIIVEDHDLVKNKSILSQLLPYISNSLKSYPDDKFGQFISTIENNKKETVFFWHADDYDIEIKKMFGEEQEGDEDHIKRKFIAEMIECSINLTIEENEENSALMLKGITNIKIGKGEDKRIYHVYYELKKSNLEDLMNAIKDENVEIIEETEDTVENSYQFPQSKTLH